MEVIPDLSKQLFRVNTGNFEDTALAVFRYQAANNEVYRQYLAYLGIKVSDIRSVSAIPCLPIDFFRTHRVISGHPAIEKTFISSGTTGESPARHHVADLKLYEESFTRCFEIFYGPVQDYCLLGLLPSYLERENASLVFMVEKLMQQSGHPLNGFYLDNMDQLAITLQKLEGSRQKAVLIGVSFALLDFAERYSFPVNQTIIMETGGMKGRREELTRPDLHERLIKSFRVEGIHSEYGMTELLSQAYALREGRFLTPPWMQVNIRDPYDPFSGLPSGASGAINIIDLANIHSIAFLATHDIGIKHTDGTFEVLGRLDHSAVRGCNLMVD